MRTGRESKAARVGVSKVPDDPNVHMVNAVDQCRQQPGKCVPLVFKICHSNVANNTMVDLPWGPMAFSFSSPDAARLRLHFAVHVLEPGLATAEQVKQLINSVPVGLSEFEHRVSLSHPESMNHHSHS